MKMRGRAELPESSLILTSVKPELTVGGTLQTRALLAPIGFEEVKIICGEEEHLSAGRLIIPKLPKGPEMNSKGPQIRKRNQKEIMGREEAVDRRNLCNRNPIRPRKKSIRHRQEEYPALDFNFLSDFENGPDALETTEPADESTSTLEPASAFIEKSRSLPESGSPSNSKDTEQRLQF